MLLCLPCLLMCISSIVNFQLWFIASFRRIMRTLTVEIRKFKCFAHKLVFGILLEEHLIMIGELFEDRIVVNQRWEKWMRNKQKARRLRLALRKLPVTKWTQGDPHETCAVCIEDFIDQEKVRVLPCSHGQCFTLNFADMSTFLVLNHVSCMFLCSLSSNLH